MSQNNHNDYNNYNDYNDNTNYSNNNDSYYVSPDYYPWYLSLWFIFIVSVFSILIIPAIIAALLINERLKYEERLIDHLEMLEHQRDEVEKVYNRREQILELAYEEERKTLYEAEQKSYAMIKRAEEESYYILKVAEQERSILLNDFSDKEEELRIRESSIVSKEKELDFAFDEISRKLTDFYTMIGDYKKEAKVEYLKKNIENNTKNTEKHSNDDSSDETDDINDTLRIKIPDEYK